MRKSVAKQHPLTTASIHHQRSRELEALSALIDANPQLAELAQLDLAGKRRTDVGREGMTGEQAIRVALLKQIHELSYRDLAFQLQDSSLFRRFSRLPFGKAIKVARIQANVKKISPETWEAINKALLLRAQAEGLEHGRKTRTDSTVVESNIHEPTDSSLLWDCVRVVTRLLNRAQELVPEADWTSFHDHQRRAKRRAFEILFPPRAKGDKEKHRRWAYEDLLGVAQQTYVYGLIAEQKLLNARPSTPLAIAQLEALRIELRHYLECMNKVMDQTRRRVINGEKVPAREKLVSIFETHTDIIVKDNRETLFGHKICLTGGASSMILDCVIEEGNPADSTLVERSIKRQAEIYGRPPRQTSYDGGFASKANLKNAKKLGVKDVAFHKKSGLDVAEMTKSPWVFRQLRNFRAGIEGCISALKRAFGLDRCTWRGLQGFKSYVWSCVVSFNAMILARHLVN